MLLGHSFFYTIRRDSPEYSGALLADIFSSVTTRMDRKTLEKFNFSSESDAQVDIVREGSRVYSLYCTSMARRLCQK